jgi:hypothetical protein
MGFVQNPLGVYSRRLERVNVGKHPPQDQAKPAYSRTLALDLSD